MSYFLRKIYIKHAPVVKLFASPLLEKTVRLIITLSLKEGEKAAVFIFTHGEGHFRSKSNYEFGYFRLDIVISHFHVTSYQRDQHI